MDCHSVTVNLSVAEPFHLSSSKQGTEAIEDIQSQLNHHLTHYKELHADSDKSVEINTSNNAKKTKQQNINQDDDTE